MSAQSSRRISLASPPVFDKPADLIAVAVALQTEAAARYAALAGELRQRGNTAVADLFDRLAREAGERGDAIGRWAQSQEIGVMEPVAIEWEPSDTGGDAPPKPGVGLDSPYRALALAVRGGDRAFRFYSYVAATATDPGVVDLAERLARERLARAAVLRARRRRAFHAQRRETGSDRLPDSAAVASLSDLLAAAAAIERRLAGRLAEAASLAPGLSAISEDALRLSDRLSQALDESGSPGPAMAQSLQSLAGGAGRSVAGEQDDSDPLRRAMADSEAAFAFYDAVVAAPASEAIMLKAQELSRCALERLSGVSTLTRSG